MLDIGQTFAGCRILEVLADTPAYRSYLVAGEESEQVKILLFGQNRSASASRRQFQKQAEQLAAKQFSSCGTPLRAGEEDGQLYCLYHLPSGPALKDRLATPFSVRQALTLIDWLAEVLSAPHSEGLSHGHLSPATIFIEGEGVFLADFGLPLLVNLDYQSGLDPRYLSPEQVRGDTPQPAADIYSLGMLTQRLLTGNCPVDGEAPFAIATHHLQGELPTLPAALSICQPLLQTMTCLSPAERVTSQQLADELQTLLCGDAIDRLEWPPINPETADPAGQGSSSNQVGVEEKSDIARRIEERLKTSPPDYSTLNAAQKAMPVEYTVEADRPVVRAAPPIGRYLLILLLGIALGSGAYLLFPSLSVPIQPEMTPSAPSQEPAIDPLSAPLNRAVELWLAGDSTAEAELQRLSNEFAEDPRIYNNLAVIAAAQGHYEQARNYLEKALTTDRNFATIYRNLGSVYAAMARDSSDRPGHLDESRSKLTLQPLSSRGPVALTAPSGGQDSRPGKQQAPATGTAERDGALPGGRVSEPSLAEPLPQQGR